MNKLFRYLILILVFGAIIVWISNLNKPSKNLRVHFCDVGEGDAEFITFPNQEKLLIDGGPNNSVLNCIGENMSFNDRKIRSILISHPDADHITGLVEVLNRYEVSEVFLTGINDDNLIYQKILSIIKEKNITIKYVYAGQSIDFGGISVKIIYPYESLYNQTVSATNQSSVVARLEDNKVNFLFTGDIDKKTAQTITANSPSLLPSQILKIPHHGSKDFYEGFVAQVKPEVSIISVGAKNRYGHPAKELTDYLNQNGFKYLRTDQKGTITIESDGQGYWEK